MNKKASAGNLILWMMLAVFFYIAMTNFMPGIKEVTDEARVNMNCTATDNTTGVQMTCIQLDLFLFLFVALAIGYIAKLLSGKEKIETQ